MPKISAANERHRLTQAPAASGRGDKAARRRRVAPAPQFRAAAVRLRVDIVQAAERSPCAAAVDAGTALRCPPS